MVTCALVRAPKLEKAEIQENFSRKRKYVNSVTSNGLLIKDLKSWDNLQQSYETFSPKSVLVSQYLASKLVKKWKILLENFFLPDVFGFCKENYSESTDGQKFEIVYSVCFALIILLIMNDVIEYDHHPYSLINYNNCCYFFFLFYYHHFSSVFTRHTASRPSTLIFFNMRDHRYPKCFTPVKNHKIIKKS